MERSSALLLVTAVLTAAIFYADTSLPLGVAGGVPYVAVVILALFLDVRGATLYAALVATALTLAGYFASPSGGAGWMVWTNRALAVFALWSVAILGHFFKRSEEALLAERKREIRTLRGLLPICAECRKIRDDEGLWRDVVRYVTEHSEADFTHGLCPECVRDLEADADRYLREREWAAGEGRPANRGERPSPSSESP